MGVNGGKMREVKAGVGWSTEVFQNRSVRKRCRHGVPAIMPLKYKFKTKDEIPAEHLPLYAEREGAWVLDVDGSVAGANAISRDTMTELFRRGEVLPEGRTNEEEVKLIAAAPVAVSAVDHSR